MKPVISFLILSALLLYSGCKKQTRSTVEYGINNQILYVGNGTEPSDLDPHVTTGLTEFNIHQALFEGLVVLDGQTLEPRPGVATSWKISEDGLRYVFELNPNAKWSNGDPMDADDFYWSFQRMLSKELAAEYAYTLFIIKNASLFNQGKIPFEEVGVKTLSPYRLEITLENIAPYFLSLLATPPLFPVHKETILQFGEMTTRASGWTHKGHVGNGPFRLKQWKFSDAVILERNPYYWDAQAVKLNEIHFKGIDNISTEERFFRTGKIHVTNSVSAPKIQDYREHDPEKLRISSDLGTYYYLFNTNVKPLDNPLVRQALNLSINRSLISNTIRQRDEPPAFHLTPNGIGNYQPPILFEENIKKAQSLLAEAGYPDGNGFPELTLLYNTSENHRAIAEAVQEMWRKHLGINISLKNEEWKVYLSSRRKSDYQICRAGWFGDYYDAENFLSLFASDTGLNTSGWESKQYDQLLAQAANARPEERLDLLRKAETILMSEVPLMPIFFYNRAILIHPSVKNWHANLLNQRLYKEIYLSSE